MNRYHKCTLCGITETYRDSHFWKMCPRKKENRIAVRLMGAGKNDA